MARVALEACSRLNTWLNKITPRLIDDSIDAGNLNHFLRLVVTSIGEVTSFAKDEQHAGHEFIRLRESWSFFSCDITYKVGVEYSINIRKRYDEVCITAVFDNFLVLVEDDA